MKRRRAVVFFSITAVALGGCTYRKGHYLTPDAPNLRFTEPATGTPKPSLTATFEFRTNGTRNVAVTEKWRPRVTAILINSGLFSFVNTAGGPADADLDMVVNNAVGSLSGPVAQGVASGFTIGLIGSKVTDDYEITTTLRRQRSDTLTRTYKRSIVSTSGLIHGSPPSVEKRPTIDAAMQAMIEQALIEFLTDVERGAQLSPPTR